jgi:hypothetical protein
MDGHPPSPVSAGSWRIAISADLLREIHHDHRAGEGVRIDESYPENAAGDIGRSSAGI